MSGWIPDITGDCWMCLFRSRFPRPTFRHGKKQNDLRVPGMRLDPTSLDGPLSGVQ